MTIFVGILVITYCAFIAGMIVAVGVSFHRHPICHSRCTRGISRWWARCWRWAGRTKRPRNEPMPLTPELVITAQQMQQIGRAMTRAGDRPTPAEFATAPPLTKPTVDRLLSELDALPQEDT